MGSSLNPLTGILSGYGGGTDAIGSDTISNRQVIVPPETNLGAILAALNTGDAVTGGVNLNRQQQLNNLYGQQQYRQNVPSSNSQTQLNNIAAGYAPNSTYIPPQNSGGVDVNTLMIVGGIILCVYFLM